MSTKIKKFQSLFGRIVDNVNSVIHGKDDVVRLALVAICSGGHILFEDVPGVGKSVLARALANSFKATINRVQCTPDILPGDITGSSVIEPKTMKFTFRPGPIFANVLLVDEINRATPKTQSALLEAMGERSVSIDGVTHPVPNPFLVMATQNPVELAGTFPLPEAQLDRFLFRLRMGYPDLEAERLVVDGNALKMEVEKLEPVAGPKDIIEMIGTASQVEISKPVQTYTLELTRATREDSACMLGASPRGSIFLSRAAKVVAAADGRDVVYPEDIKSILVPALGHRLILNADAILRGESVEDVLGRVTSRVKLPLGVSEEVERTPTSATSGRPTRRPVRGKRVEAR